MEKLSSLRRVICAVPSEPLHVIVLTRSGLSVSRVAKSVLPEIPSERNSALIVDPSVTVAVALIWGAGLSASVVMAASAADVSKLIFNIDCIVSKSAAQRMEKVRKIFGGSDRRRGLP